MAADQVHFTTCISRNHKTVHLLGSWDNYSSCLPLSKDPKSDGWSGCLELQGPTLKQGQRYWYYYVVDGCHAVHDPTKDFTTELTTGYKLNILDILEETKTSSARHSRRVSASIPKGRGISPSRIVAPRPERPYQTRRVINMQYYEVNFEAFATRFAHQTLDFSSDDDSGYSLDDSSDVPSLISRSTSGSNSSSINSGSSRCTCQRFGITRKGNRVKLDCGGARCGDNDDSDDPSDCSCEEERGTISIFFYL